MRANVEKHDLLGGLAKDDHDPVAVGETDGVLVAMPSLEAMKAQPGCMRIGLKLTEDVVEQAGKIRMPPKELPSGALECGGPDKRESGHGMVSRGYVSESSLFISFLASPLRTLPAFRSDSEAANRASARSLINSW